MSQFWAIKGRSFGGLGDLVGLGALLVVGCTVGFKVEGLGVGGSVFMVGCAEGEDATMSSLVSLVFNPFPPSTARFPPSLTTIGSLLHMVKSSWLGSENN